MNGCPVEGNLSCPQTVEPVLCLLVQLLCLHHPRSCSGSRTNNRTHLFLVFHQRPAVSPEVLMVLEGLFFCSWVTFKLKKVCRKIHLKTNSMNKYQPSYVALNNIIYYPTAIQPHWCYPSVVVLLLKQRHKQNNHVYSSSEFLLHE